MPLHEFACQSCGHRFEELVSASEKPACPKCQSRKLDKLLSTFAVKTAPGGGSSGGSAADFGPGACGSCGDPRGPGSCGMN